MRTGSRARSRLTASMRRLAWDESNLTLHEIERETQAARMKIDEPKTPFVRSASLGSMDEDASEWMEARETRLAEIGAHLNTL